MVGSSAQWIAHDESPESNANRTSALCRELVPLSFGSQASYQHLQFSLCLCWRNPNLSNSPNLCEFTL
jgi:hypothetical protein